MNKFLTSDDDLGLLNPLKLNLNQIQHKVKQSKKNDSGNQAQHKHENNCI